jgi:thymidylate synthase (FAD)
MIRHRAGWGYSQLSQRFVDESETDYVEPDIIASDPELHEIWLAAVRHAHESYLRLAEGLAAKVARERQDLKARNRRIQARQAARSVLPNATETKIFMTANARALRHFIEYRGAPDAEPEIRKVAIAVLEIMRCEAPALFGDYELATLPDGSRTASTTHKKV